MVFQASGTGSGSRMKIALIRRIYPMVSCISKHFAKKNISCFCDRLSFKKCLCSKKKKKKNHKRDSVCLLNKQHICLLSVIKYLGSLNTMDPFCVSVGQFSRSVMSDSL